MTLLPLDKVNFLNCLIVKITMSLDANHQFHTHTQDHISPNNFPLPVINFPNTYWDENSTDHKFSRGLWILPPNFLHLWEFLLLENSHFKIFNHFYYNFCIFSISYGCKIEKNGLTAWLYLYIYIYLMILSFKTARRRRIFFGLRPITYL